MGNGNYTDFGEEISRTIERVLNDGDIRDLKNTINRAMLKVRKVQEMSSASFSANSHGEGGDFPPLSMDKNDPGVRNPNVPKQGAYGGHTASGTMTQRPQYRKKHNGGSLVPGTLFLTSGILCAVCFGTPALVGFIMENAAWSFPFMGLISKVFGALFLVSFILVFHGIGLRKRAKRFRLYRKVLNDRTHCTIKEFTAAGGWGTKFIVKDLRKMIRAGLFEEGYLDEQETCFMTDYPTYSQYAEAMKNARRRQEEEEREKAENPEGWDELRKTVAEGKNYIREIKAANDALPEADISEKLDTLEQITSKIFDYVEQHPDKLPEIRKFMSYYMPITLKLVNAYQRFGIHGSNTSETEDAKLEIRGTLDTINKAYRNLLTKLMQADILDVSSDISALETILAQEGLTGDGFAAKSTRLH
jgi:5-bromo-4-chloroindolyl phosphate hydrolysis protein